MDLLDWLREMIGCAFVSDLRYVHLTPTQEKMLRALPGGSFSLREFQDAAQYLTQHNYVSEDTAREAIIAALKRQEEE